MTVAMMLVTVAAAISADGRAYDEPQGRVNDIRSSLNRALESRDAADSDEQLRAAAAQAVEMLTPHSPAGERLAAAVAESQQKSSAEGYASLRQVITEVLTDLNFAPIAEAELPAGFPTYTPVGMIEVKQYPAYRLASGPGFWTLFMHIQANNIAMTAPVEMTYEASDKGLLRQSEMAFLYGDPQTGKSGPRGKVEVADKQRQMVVSLGVRGDRSTQDVADARERLLRWIEASGKYRAAGSTRVMGYNSPYVPRARQYAEVQIPIEESAPASP